MNTVLITGAEGFIGKNLCATLALDQDVELLKFDIGNTIEQLHEYVSRADFIFHLAGINRPENIGEFDKGNRGFTEQLLNDLNQSGRRIPLAVTSSIQALLDNPYGKSKKAAEAAVSEWSKKCGAPAYIYRLPNVFGKWSRPNYNSAVATFCHNICRGLPIKINDAGAKLSLVYIDDVVEDFVSALKGRKTISDDGFCYVSPVFNTTVGGVSALIECFEKSRTSLVMPELTGNFERDLYATYVSFLPENGFSYPLDMKKDSRGWLAEFIKSAGFGQIFISKTKPGITRGNHWHHTKVEKFLVIQGEGLVKFRKIDGEEVLEYPVSGDNLFVVDIPTGYTHSITNTGESELITIFWSDQIFDQAKPDTFYLGV